MAATAWQARAPNRGDAAHSVAASMWMPVWFDGAAKHVVPLQRHLKLARQRCRRQHVQAAAHGRPRRPPFGWIIWVELHRASTGTYNATKAGARALPRHACRAWQAGLGPSIPRRADLRACCGWEVVEA